MTPPRPPSDNEAAPSVLCIGAVVRDTLATASAPLAVGDDVPGSVVQRVGGVAANIACALVQHDCAATLVGALGEDTAASELLEELAGAGVDCRHLKPYPGNTDQVITLEGPDGERFAAVADCQQWDAVSRTRRAWLCDLVSGFEGPVVLDGNAGVACLDAIMAAASGPVTIVPASEVKVAALRELIAMHGPAVVVNRREAERLLETTFRSSLDAAVGLLGLGARESAVTDGARDATLATQTTVSSRRPPTVRILSTTGAGDAFAAGLVAFAHLPAAERLAHALQSAAQHLETTLR
ncbi:MAG: PfkB family carbohydrate kinase [Pseudomonadota bacterium]